MSTTTLTVEKDRLDRRCRSRDYLELTKPRISLMVLVTVTISQLVALSGSLSLALLLPTLIGTALVAASASAWNQLLEKDQDGRMERTAGRPLPAGRLGMAEVVVFGCFTLLSGLLFLLLLVGWQPALWALATWLLYVGLYTPLKSRSMWNTAVGAISGALPVVIGWTATGTPLDTRLVTLVLILFCWQFPHFVAIAWLYRYEYARAGMQMLTVTDPSGRLAGWHAVGGATLVLAVGLLPTVGDAPNLVYATASGLLGLYLVAAACRFQRRLCHASARRLLAASIVYLPLSLGLIALQPFL
jgi:protoheme IX farnesyltransferase